jgi:hypothetical protein
MIKHKHHIIPKHMGGTDDPSNLIELTIEEHAEAHRILWENHGRWQDEVAWKALSGQIDKQEINYIISVINNTGKNNPMYGKVGPMRGKKHTEESKQKIKSKRKEQVIIHSEETKLKIGQAHKGKIITDEHIEKVIESNKKRLGEKRNIYKNKGTEQKVIECPHCHKAGGQSSMHRWHFNNCKVRKIL